MSQIQDALLEQARGMFRSGLDEHGVARRINLPPTVLLDLKAEIEAERGLVRKVAPTPPVSEEKPRPIVPAVPVGQTLATVISPVRNRRTTSHLRDVLFSELEALRDGRTTPKQAMAVAKLAQQITETLKADVAVEVLLRGKSVTGGEVRPALLVEGET